MFRALAGFEDMGHKNYVTQQTNTFTKQLPDMVGTTMPKTAKQAPKDVLSSARFGLSSWDPNTRQANLNNIDIANYATSIELSQEILDAQQRCKTATLDDLINTVNPGDRFRCGWIYQKGTPGDQPKVSVGAVGTRSGPAPFFQNPAGRWYWSLDEAKKAVMGDRCAALTNCKNVGAANYAGCAFSSTRGIGVPVNRNGTVMYPRDEALTAPASSLITTAGRCPAPPSPGTPQYEFAKSRDVCTPLEDGSLSRDCMLQQITAAGCSQDGSLYQALVNQATPNNYAAGIMQTNIYKKYQQLASVPLLESAVRDGKTSTDLALANFKALAAEANTVRDTVQNFAARDLCLKRGTFDKFDFCTELIDGSLPPFALECLQREFRKQGGQPAGTMYPTLENKATLWDSQSNWGAVKRTMADLKALINNQKESVQRDALKKFLGIERKSQPTAQISKIQGLEILFFNRARATFIGRRVNTGDGKYPFMHYDWGDVEGTGLSDFVEFYTVANIRPTSDVSIRLRLDTDDGVIYSLNKPVDGDTSRGQYIGNDRTLSANWDQAPTAYVNPVCWQLVSGGPNYVMGFWQETGGMVHHKVLYSECNSQNFRELPSEWLSLTQEPDAPMLSWQGRETETGQLEFVERRFPTVMQMTLSSKITVDEAPSTDIPGLKAVANLRVGENGYGLTKKNIGMNSWRTLTCLFYVNSATPVQSLLLNLGPLSVFTNQRNLEFSWQSATLTKTGTFGGLVTDKKTPFLLVVNMRSDYTNRYPNRFTIACASVADWKAGRVSLAAGTNNSLSVTTTGNQPLYNITDAFQLKLGDPNTRASADVSVGWVRLFDYELQDADVVRDANNAWKMAFAK